MKKRSAKCNERWFENTAKTLRQLAFVARELAPAGVRSAPKKPAPAALSNGSKLPRHSKPAPTLDLRRL
ncbi:hypothetical protein C7A10_08725 [Pseudomonas fluorescens]|uniref:Uncharacterized protein n=1 Tax=Pseudomonas fluorescens TaxID=294 RepID=A0A2T0IFB1_PSEFL|nr:hypothetical protein C7A10_08725 [Pseudomonas fluorescens]